MACTAIAIECLDARTGKTRDHDRRQAARSQTVPSLPPANQPAMMRDRPLHAGVNGAGSISASAKRS
jgi:hypothetical protein